MSSANRKPVAMTMGVTGQLGKLIADHLINDPTITQVVTSRKKEQLPKLKEQYGEAVYMDLDDPRTFSKALENVDRLFMLTGYTVAMLVQSKAIVDAAKKAGVKHIVHLGVYTPKFDCYDPHFAWHQMVEAYIQQSGIPYTFLHPNCFMQNFTGFYGMANKGRVVFYGNDKKVGWIALEDVALATAKILSEGPSKHAGKDYWFSTESLNIHEVAEIFTEVTGKTFVADAFGPEQFIIDFGKGKNNVDPYFDGIIEFYKQLVDGRMSYMGNVQDDMPLFTGRKGMTLKEWAELHKDELLKVSKHL